MNLILLGAPGAGKGTQAKMISQKYNIVHISTGDILRDMTIHDTDLAKKVQVYIQSGSLVPDEIMEDLVKEKLKRCFSGSGFLLDGFPRNLRQTQMLDEYLIKIGQSVDRVIYLGLSGETIINRLKARRYCPQCKRNYNLITHKPKKDELCDFCNIEVISRIDDTEDTIRDRLSVFQTETSPVVSYYAKQNKLKRIDAEGTVEQVSADISNLIEGRNA